MKKKPDQSPDASKAHRQDEIVITKERLEAMVASSTVMLYASQAFGDFDAIYISDNINAITGYTNKDFHSKGFWVGHIHPEDAPKVSENLTKLFEHDYHKHEYRFMFKDGTYHWMYDEMRLIRDKSGNPVEIIGTWTDITNRKQVEQETVILHNAVEHSPDIIYITDRDGQIEYVNPAFETGTGYSKEEAIGQTPRILKSGLMEPEYYQKLWATILSGKVFRSEVADRKKNGEIYYYDQTVTPIKGLDGKITHFISTGKDVTERKQVENEIRTRERYFALLNQITHTILASRDSGTIYQTLAQSLAGLFEADDCYITHWNEEEQQTIPIISTVQLERPFSSFHLKPGDVTITASIMAKGQVLAVEDFLNSPHFNASLTQQFPFRSALGIPFIVEEHKYGAAVIAFNTLHHFSLEEIARAEQAGRQIALALWTAQQEAEIQKQLRESNVLAKIARELGKTERVGLSKVLQLIAASAKELIPSSEQAVIHLLDEEQQFLTPEAVIGFEESTVGKIKIRPNQGVAGQVIVSGETINIPDVKTDPRFLTYNTQPSYRSLMVAPVQTGERILGTISVQSSLVNAFTEAENRLLSALGTQAAIAIENAHLLESTQEALKETNALYRINQGLVVSLEPQELLQDVVELLQKNFNYYHVQIYVADPDTGDFIMRAGSGEIGRQLMEQGYRLHVGEGIVGYTAETDIPFFTNNVDNMVSFARNPLLPDTKSELAVPVKIEGRIVGLLDIQQVPPGILTQRDIQLVSAVADQLAIALQKANLYTDLQTSLQMEKAIRNQLVQNERLATMGRLLASVSHELNNPLQAIQNALFLLREEEEMSLQGRQDLDIVLSESERMAGLISRLRATYRPVQMEDFQLMQINDIIEDVYALIATHLRHNDISFEFHPDPSLPAIPGLTDQIRQVMLNLLMNAVEAMTTGGRLTVSTQCLDESGEVLIKVSDTGTGIDPGILLNIFDAFVTNKQSGTGLGLTITYDIIIKHRGRIQAENNPEHGATFNVWLPCKQKENQ